IANTGLTTPLVVLSLTLFALLLFSGLLNAMRIHLMEIFGRRFYARMVAEISMRSIFAQNPFFNDQSRGALFNRYFDIITVQKTMPVLFIGGFTVILQSAVGFVLVSMYHPLFLAFNIVMVLLIWAVWLIWGAAAVRSAIDLSHRKYQTAAWLEGIGGSDGFFKSERRIDYALKATDDRTADYVEQHRRHFRRHFSQTLAFLVLYAGASAMLLGLGGWLVIQGQLTLGQLVAAELILSAVFFGVSQLGIYLNYIYDLCAAVEELSLFYDVDQEQTRDGAGSRTDDPTLSFIDVRGAARGRPVRLDFEIPGGQGVMVAAYNHGVQRLFTNMLKRHQSPEGGYVLFGGVDLSSIDSHRLRQDVFVLDRPSFMSMTIREYLEVSAEDSDPRCLIKALDTVGLAPVIAQLEEGLDTLIASTGWPLSVPETMQLKLAGALLARPSILVLGQVFDAVGEITLAAAVREIREDPSISVVYFSNRSSSLDFDSFLYMGETAQIYFDDFDKFYEHTRSNADPRRQSPRLIHIQSPPQIGRHDP
ncbi:MAG: ABC transporter ATP-binding protein, partial [Pseudomonadota bacterium]